MDVRRFVLPVAALLTAAVTMRAQNAGFDDGYVAGGIRRTGSVAQSDWVSTFSDVSQYLPGGMLAVTCLTYKLNGRQSWRDVGRLALTGAIGAATETAIVNALKYTVRRPRPDGGAATSFPSGHSATSFFLATMLHREYGRTVSPWFSVAGYGIAAAGSLGRVATHHHWTSDVLCGAAIGVAAGEFAYWLGGRIAGRWDLYVWPDDWPDGSTWSFGLHTHYNFDRLAGYGGCGTPDGLRPGATSGVYGTRRLCNGLGVIVSADMTQLRWNGGDDLTLPDGGALPLLKTLRAGVAGSLPLGGPFSAFTDLQAGYVFGGNCRLSDGGGALFDATLPSGFDARLDLGFSLRTTETMAVRLYGGLEHYGGYGLLVSAGTAFSLVF